MSSLRPLGRRGVAAVPVIAAALLFLGSTAGCRRSLEAEPSALPLVDRFDEATVTGSPEAPAAPPRLEWRFGEATAAADTGTDATLGWRALHGVRSLAVRDGRLVGRTGETPLLAVAGPSEPDPNDFLHSVEIELRVSAGTRLGFGFDGEETLDEEEAVEWARESALLSFNKTIEPGDELRTYVLTSADATFRTSIPLRELRHIVVRPTDAADADFEIASIRVVTMKEHLASVPSGIGWHGLGEVFRETIVARAPESVAFDLRLPADPFLDLSIGTFDPFPVTFEVEVASDGERQRLLRRTLTRAQVWETLPLDLAEHGGEEVTLTLTLRSERPGAIGFWGSPVVRNRGGRPQRTEPSPGRSAVLGPDREPPQGVILIVADTLRRDQFQPYGYERPNAPTLARLAGEGSIFRDAIAQGAWTKVSVSSLMTSLYPTSHGVADMPDRLPAGVTTVAEAYRGAGYATFATSSVPFTGRLTNLHQGFEVLHEATSVPDEGFSESKTSRTYVDRLLEWIEVQREVPFFAFLHVFDPHSPFEPYRPWASEFMGPESMTQHRKDLETVREFIEDDHMKGDGLPTREEIERSGVDIDRFLAHERAWYDASVRAMDVEIARLLERLEELGLADRVLIAFTSDHGEEFLEHGRHFHGHTVYGEMLNVPLFLWWPGGLPAGREVARTVQGIDLVPTLLDVSRIPVPEQAQGLSLLPLLAGDDASAREWGRRPAFSERSPAPAAFSDASFQRSSRSVVADGWKLIHNVERPDGVPEYELFDHSGDPLNLHDVAAEHPEVVARLRGYLEAWHARALAARVAHDDTDAQMSPEEAQKLRALGYL